MKLKWFRIRKPRKYPIKYDKEGFSLRAKCFQLFEQGQRPVAVVEELKMKETTVFRYFDDWKRLGPNFEQKYAYVQSLFKKSAPDCDKNLELFAKTLRIEKEQLEAILSQSHGLRRLMTGKLHFPAQEDADHKRHIALELALLISEFVLKNGGQFQDVYFALRRYMGENMKNREEEDADIEEDNKMMALFHQILAKDMENELKGRVKPDTFSEEERKAIIRLGVEQERKKLEISYWLRIGALIAEGLTAEQACEKIYQNLLEKNDLKGAKLMREFQDKVHPLGKNDQAPPPSPDQPSSSS